MGHMSWEKSAFPGGGTGCTSWELGLVGCTWHWGTTPISSAKFLSAGISPELQHISVANPHLFRNPADSRRGQEVWAVRPNHELAVEVLIWSVHPFCSATCLSNSISSALAFSFSLYRDLICFSMRKQAFLNLELMALKQIPQRLSGSTEQQNNPGLQGCFLPLCGPSTSSCSQDHLKLGEQSMNRIYTLPMLWFLTRDFLSLALSG